MNAGGDRGPELVRVASSILHGVFERQSKLFERESMPVVDSGESLFGTSIFLVSASRPSSLT